MPFRRQVLDLTGAAPVTDEGVAALAACTALRQLVLSWCAEESGSRVLAWDSARISTDVVRLEPGVLGLHDVN